MSRDLYSILNVSRSADENEIKRAYRQLARQLHPDVNKDKDAAARFSEVQEAYDVLSDPAKRRYYDQFGVVPGSAAADAGAARPGPRQTRSAGPMPFDLDAEEMGSMFESFFGVGARGGDFRAGPVGRSGTRQTRTPAQPPVEAPLLVTFLTSVRGGTEEIRLNVDGKARTIEVNIPAGCRDGQQLRIRGGAGDRDVLITVRVGEHPVFRRGDGLDLLVDLPLNLAEATLGAAVRVRTLDDAVELQVPPATASGSRLRLRGRGIRASTSDVGDLYAVVRIIPPDPADLTEDQRRALAEIGRTQGDVRAARS